MQLQILNPVWIKLDLLCCVCNVTRWDWLLLLIDSMDWLRLWGYIDAFLVAGGPGSSTAVEGLLTWQRLTSQYSGALQGDSDSIERLTQCVQYVEKCIETFGGGLSDPLNQDCKAQLAFEAVFRLVERMQKICSSRALMSLAKGTLKGHDLKTVLPSKHLSLANALQTDFVRSQWLGKCWH